MWSWTGQWLRDHAAEIDAARRNLMQREPKRKTWYPGDLVTIIDDHGDPFADGVIVSLVRDGLGGELWNVQTDAGLTTMTPHYLRPRYCWRSAVGNFNPHTRNEK